MLCTEDNGTNGLDGPAAFSKDDELYFKKAGITRYDGLLKGITYKWWLKKTGRYKVTGLSNL